jgi:predicted AlkP superfamily pyrophosphatase or phosphodiesterase
MCRIFLNPFLASFVLLIALSCAPNAHAEENVDYFDHIIILAFDGWGASSFETADMPFLKSKLAESAWTMHKRSILPTSSACNWASMFKGAGPEAHGYIAWDTKKPAFSSTYTDEKGNFPSFFSVYREAFPEREMGYFYQWDGMWYIFDMNDFNYVKGFAVSDVGSELMKDAAISYIMEKKPAVAAFFWDYPDKIGHTIGWYTDAYMNELTHIDSIIKDIVDACVSAGIFDNTLFVITSDHGGHDKTHGQPVISDLETPLILLGKGISPGEINVPVMQYDVAAILADYMNLEHPMAWRGVTPKWLFY